MSCGRVIDKPICGFPPGRHKLKQLILWLWAYYRQRYYCYNAGKNRLDPVLPCRILLAFVILELHIQQARTRDLSVSCEQNFSVVWCLFFLGPSGSFFLYKLSFSRCNDLSTSPNGILSLYSSVTNIASCVVRETSLISTEMLFINCSSSF